MTTSAPRRPAAPGGFTLLELMIALVVLLVALTGFVGAANQSVNSTAIAHRRTLETALQAGLTERLVVSPRSELRRFPEDTWMLEACFDEHGHVVAANTPDPGSPYDPAFACPASATLPSTEVAIPAYRRWIRVKEVSPESWYVATVVERISAGCDPDDRDHVIGCVYSDLLLND